MTTYGAADTAIVNRALQVIGTRTNVTTSELNSLGSNEAIQINLIYTAYRDQLLRMAPWNCGINYANMVYLTSVPGTPENTTAATNLWTPGQPAPPWAYEYLYPDDCLRCCFVIPANQTGFADGVPITTAVTGGAPAFWQGQPIKFKVALDRYLNQASGIGIVSGGFGFTVGDTLIAGGAPPAGSLPAGLVNASVTSVGAGGVITGVALANFNNLDKNSLLFAQPTYDLPQVQTSGFGTGASLSVAGVTPPAFSARTILTNQEYATLAYVQQVTDPTVMDVDFVEAWINTLGAGLANALTGDKSLANLCVARANEKIALARQTDGNEGLTLNDVTPDFIRIRGIAWTEYYNGPWAQFDWGSYWPVY